MSNFLKRIGNAFHALGGRTPEPAQKAAGAPFPFDKIPVTGGGGGDRLSRPFEESVWVQAAIKKVSGPITEVTLRFRDPSTKQEIEDGPWLEFWQAPAAHADYSVFVESLVGWLKLDGENFILLQPEFAKPFPDVVTKWPPLMLARPDCVRAVVKHGQLEAWEIRSRDGGRLLLPVNQVIHSKYWNPYDDIRGMSEYEAARVAAEGDYLSGKFALNIARSNGNTGLIVNLDGAGVPDEAQQQQINQSLRLWQEKSRRGEFSTVMIPAGLKLDDPRIKSTDANFVAQRLQNRHEIFIAFGVPPSMADIQASYSVGSASDWYRLIVDSCIPAGSKLARGISTIASIQAGRKVEAYFDWDEHPVMQAVRRERVDAWTKLVDRGVPGEDASDYLDLDLPEYPAGKVGLLPFSLAPFGETPAPEEDSALSDIETVETDEADEAVQEALHAIRALRARNVTPPAPPAGEAGEAGPCVCGCEIGDLTMRAGDSADVKLWKSRMAVRREVMAAYSSKFTRHLMLARREVLAKLDRAIAQEVEFKAKGKPVTRATAIDFLFDLNQWRSGFHAAMRGVTLDALQKGGDQVFAELKRDDPWKMPAPEALRFLKDRENKLNGVPDDVYGRIRDTISDGLTNGDPLRKIADSVRAEFNQISERRAKLIATTETSAAFGTSRHSAMKAAGVKFKRWLVSGNSNVRASHRAMNGVIIPVDSPFVVTNLEAKSKEFGAVDEIMHPADSTGAPWNVINCNCVELASAEPSTDEVEPSV